METDFSSEVQCERIWGNGHKYLQGGIGKKFFTMGIGQSLRQGPEKRASPSLVTGVSQLNEVLSNLM